MRATLGFFLGLAIATAASAQTCEVDPTGAPEAAQALSGVVRGPATPQEIASQTAIAAARAHAQLSPKYANLPRAFVYFELDGVRHGIIAAVLDGVMPRPGEIVTLISRHRDPDFPCAFVPWTIIRGAPT